jgi:hypothetical protein
VVIMQVQEAKHAAAAWVVEHQANRPDFRGAFFSGSTTELPPTSELPSTSDVDVVVLLATSATPPKLGKFEHRGVLLEVTYLPWQTFVDVEEVAGTFFLAPSFRSDQAISDPTGQLRRLHQRISPRFAEPAEVRRRYENVISRIEAGLAGADSRRPWHDQVTSWLFSTSLPTLVVLVAALQNPTVRLRYLRARNVLAEHHRSDVYGELLGLLGCAEARPEQVQRHLDRLALTFDVAAQLARTPFFFSSDITAAARPIAIRGGQDLIDAGLHREAVFWVLATFARCQQVLTADAPEVAAETAPRFAEAVADLVQVERPEELRARSAQVLAFLPRLRATAETILSA